MKREEANRGEAGGRLKRAATQVTNCCAIKQKHPRQREVREVAAPVKSKRKRKTNDDGGVSGAVVGPGKF